MSVARSATIVIRSKGSRPDVVGPLTFLGGYPIYANGERDGIYGEWHWNGEKLRAQVDRLGMFPLFYCELPNGIAISTSISELIKAGADPEIDWAALQLLFRMGFGVGCDTVFRAIKAFPVGGKLTWTPGSLEVTECYPEIKINPVSREEAIDGYIDLFRSAMKRRIVEGAPIKLPLSGGRDSRHILLELVRLGLPPECCYTSCYSTMRDDVEVARQLCSAVGVPHIQTRSPENEDIVRADLEKNELTSFQALEHGWVWLVAQSMADSEAVIYDGIAGDVLSAGLFHNDENSRLYREGRFDDLARRLAPERPLVLLPRHWREAVAAVDPYPALIKELRRYRDAWNPMMLFFLYNRSRRAVTVLSNLWEQVSRAVYVPFLDRDVFDFLAGLPEAMFADKTFHTQTIVRGYPEIGGMAFAKKTPTPRDLQRRYASQGLQFAIRASSPLVDRLAVLPRLGRSLFSRRYGQEAIWVLHEAVMLSQLGQLQQSQTDQNVGETVPLSRAATAASAGH